MKRRNALKFMGLGLGGLSVPLAGTIVPQAEKGISIKKINPLVIKGPTRMKELLFVEVITDQGITGYGECYPWNLKNKKRIDDLLWLARETEGKNPTDINLFHHQYGAKRYNLEYPCAFSAIENALWDILGKVTGRSVADLLGGALRSEVPLYANHGIFTLHPSKCSSEWKRDRALLAKDMGFTFFKWDPFHKGGDVEWEVLKKDVAEVQMVRDALGKDFKIGLDAHTRWNRQGATKAISLLNDMKIEFLEEPVKKEDYEHMPELASLSKIPLALGERLIAMKEAKSALDLNSIGYIQPDLGNFGGIINGYKCAEFATLYGVKFLPHLWTSRILTLATAQVCACASNLAYMEYPATAPDDAWEKDLLIEDFTIRDGNLRLPAGPGLGSDLNMDFVNSRRLLL